MDSTTLGASRARRRRVARDGMRRHIEPLSFPRRVQVPEHRPRERHAAPHRARDGRSAPELVLRPADVHASARDAHDGPVGSSRRTGRRSDHGLVDPRSADEPPAPPAAHASARVCDALAAASGPADAHTPPSDGSGTERSESANGISGTATRRICRGIAASTISSGANARASKRPAGDVTCTYPPPPLYL